MVGKIGNWGRFENLAYNSFLKWGNLFLLFEFCLGEKKSIRNTHLKKNLSLHVGRPFFLARPQCTVNTGERTFEEKHLIVGTYFQGRIISRFRRFKSGIEFKFFLPGSSTQPSGARRPERVPNFPQVFKNHCFPPVCSAWSRNPRSARHTTGPSRERRRRARRRIQRLSHCDWHEPPGQWDHRWMLKILIILVILIKDWKYKTHRVILVQRQPGEVGGKLIVNLNRSEEHIRCKGEQSWERKTHQNLWMERPRLVPGGELLDGDYFFLYFANNLLTSSANWDLSWGRAAASWIS